MATPYILDLLSNLKARVATNETNIATNKTNIAANKKSIDDHKKDDTRHWTTADRQNFDRVVHFKGYFTTEAALKAGVTSPQVGDYAIVGETDTVWLWDDATSSWLNSTEQGIVISVNGRTGEVVLAKKDVGLSNVDNTADVNKPVSKPQQAALDNKADRKVITEAEADGFTLRSGIYDLANVTKTILNFTSKYWTIIVGEQTGNSNKPATQIWITYEAQTGVSPKMFFRRQVTQSSWSDFVEVATNLHISNLQTQVTTNKNNIKTNADDIGTLESDKADRREITATEADGFDLRAGIYEGNLARTILGFTSTYWAVIVSEGVSKKSGTQIWIAYDAHHQNKHMYFRKVYNNNGTSTWTQYSELITSDILSSTQIENINHYKGYFATAAALAATGTGKNGDYAIVGENQVMYIWNSTKNAWTSIINDTSLGSGTVTSVNGETGAVVLTKSSIGLTNVDNTADKDKEVKNATTLKTARKIDGVSFNGSADIIHYGTCSTAAATAAKTVSCTGFTLTTGARIEVKFTATNTATNPTLNVNNTGAKPIVYNGSTTVTAGYIRINDVVPFVYDGTNYVIARGLHTVYQTLADTVNKDYPLLFASAGRTNDGEAMTHFGTKLQANPSTGKLQASVFNMDNKASIKYDATNNKIQFLIGTTVVATISNTGVFNCNELTENTGTTL